MQKPGIFVACFTFVIILGISVSANALLVDNDDGTVTQSRNDGSILMWLKDANYSMTSGYDADGRMTWDQAQLWISTLNSSNYLGYNDWRLPVTLPVNGSTYDYDFSYDGSTDYGWNITSPNSEMAYMYYVELEKKGYFDTNGDAPQTGWGLGTDTDPFTNLQTSFYWSGTENGSLGAWGFYIGYGDQMYKLKDESRSAWAVRTVPFVPEPISSILFITGGTFLAGRRLLKRKKIVYPL